MYRRMCEDPYFANIPGKIELDVWGRIVMSPASPYHGMIQARLIERLARLGGQPIAEAAIVTSVGILVTDVAWASTEFVSAHSAESPFTRAPELMHRSRVAVELVEGAYRKGCGLPRDRSGRSVARVSAVKALRVLLDQRSARAHSIRDRSRQPFRLSIGRRALAARHPTRLRISGSARERLWPHRRQCRKRCTRPRFGPAMQQTRREN